MVRSEAEPSGVTDAMPADLPPLEGNAFFELAGAVAERLADLTVGHARAHAITSADVLRLRTKDTVIQDPWLRGGRRGSAGSLGVCSPA